MALIAVFVVLISLPLAGLILGFDRAFVLEENRNLAPRPELKLDRAALAALPGRFEAYFNDHFGFRKRLIYWLAVVKVQGLGVTSTPGVTLGSNGWLYLASDAAVLSYRAARPFTPAQLEAVPADSSRRRRDWLAARGIPYLMVIPPNKDTIYPEFMPAAYNKVNPRSRLDQLVDYMKDHSSVSILDIREDLRRAKQVERVYRRHGQPLEPEGRIYRVRADHAGPRGVVSPGCRRCRDRSFARWWKTVPAATSRGCWASPIEFPKSD